MCVFAFILKQLNERTGRVGPWDYRFINRNEREVPVARVICNLHLSYIVKLTIILFYVF